MTFLFGLTTIKKAITVHGSNEFIKEKKNYRHIERLFLFRWGVFFWVFSNLFIFGSGCMGKWFAVFGEEIAWFVEKSGGGRSWFFTFFFWFSFVLFG